jgi:tripartite ATP-independent transporter DctP family solute receptor
MLTRRHFTAAGAAVLAAPTIRRGDAQTRTVVRYGDVLPANHPSVAVMADAAREIAEGTSGRYELQLFPNSQLGVQRDMIEALSSGVQQMGADGAATFGPWVPAFPVLEAPYIWRDAAHLAKGMASPDGQRLIEQLVRTRSIRILATNYYGTRQLTTAEKEVRHPRDMVGFKLRVPPSDVFNAMAESWGARPTPITFGELYLALRQGVVDGQENPLPTIQAGKFFEVQKYLVLTAHIITPRVVVVNERFWRGLSDADRGVFQRAVDKAIERANAEILRQEQELIATFRQSGMTVIEPDVPAFREAVLRAVPPRFQDRWGQGVFERLQAIS